MRRSYKGDNIREANRENLPNAPRSDYNLGVPERSRHQGASIEDTTTTKYPFSSFPDDVMNMILTYVYPSCENSREDRNTDNGEEIIESFGRVSKSAKASYFRSKQVKLCTLKFGGVAFQREIQDIKDHIGREIREACCFKKKMNRIDFNTSHRDTRPIFIKLLETCDLKSLDRLSFFLNSDDDLEAKGFLSALGRSIGVSDDETCGEIRNSDKYFQRQVEEVLRDRKAQIKILELSIRVGAIDFHSSLIPSFAPHLEELIINECGDSTSTSQSIDRDRILEMLITAVENMPLLKKISIYWKDDKNYDGEPSRTFGGTIKTFRSDSVEQLTLPNGVRFTDAHDDDFDNFQCPQLTKLVLRVRGGDDFPDFPRLPASLKELEMDATEPKPMEYPPREIQFKNLHMRITELPRLDIFTMKATRAGKLDIISQSLTKINFVEATEIRVPRCECPSLLNFEIAANIDSYSNLSYFHICKTLTPHRIFSIEELNVGDKENENISGGLRQMVPFRVSDRPFHGMTVHRSCCVNVAVGSSYIGVSDDEND